MGSGEAEGANFGGIDAMRKSGLLVLALSALLSGAWGQTFPQTQRGGMNVQPPTRTWPLEHPLGRLKWDRNGYLIHHHASADPQPLIWVYTTEGQLVGHISPARALTDARGISLKDAAVTKKGTLLVAATARSKKNALASALLEFDLQGKLQRIIKTDPFVPKRIALDGDGNVWMFGYDWQRFDKDDNWAQVHKLSPDGRILVSTLPRSLFPKELDPLDPYGPGILASDIYFEIVEDRVYAWLPGVDSLVILAVDGGVLQLVNHPFTSLKRTGGALSVSSVVFLPKDRLIVQATNFGDSGPFGYGWFLSTDWGRTWSPVLHSLGRDPSAYFTYQLIGLTSQEAIFLRLTGPDVGVVELCPFGR